MILRVFIISIIFLSQNILCQKKHKSPTWREEKAKPYHHFYVGLWQFNYTGFEIGVHRNINLFTSYRLVGLGVRPSSKSVMKGSLTLSASLTYYPIKGNENLLSVNPTINYIPSVKFPISAEISAPVFTNTKESKITFRAGMFYTIPLERVDVDEEYKKYFSNRLDQKFYSTQTVPVIKVGYSYNLQGRETAWEIPSHQISISFQWISHANFRVNSKDSQSGLNF